MGTWAEIREGMKTQLETISGLVVHDVMRGKVADKDVAFVLYGDPLVISSGHGSLVSVGVQVSIRVSRGNVEDAQRAIDPYLWPVGEQSIVAAVLADPTLGDVVHETQWRGTGAPGANPPPSFEYLQADISFRCTVDA